jgi:hypothetical protein
VKIPPPVGQVSSDVCKWIELCQVCMHNRTGMYDRYGPVCKTDIDRYVPRYRYGIVYTPVSTWTGMYPDTDMGRYVPLYRYWPVFKSILYMKILFRVVIVRLYIYEGPPRGRRIQFFTHRYKYM